MPRYDYYCEANGRTVEVVHSISERMTDWGEVCARANLDPGETDPESPVRKVITSAPMANTPVGDSTLKNWGFSKLVRRDDGVYENTTRTGTESRYVRAGDPSTMPDLRNKLGD